MLPAESFQLKASTRDMVGGSGDHSYSGRRQGHRLVTLGT